jgi:hypothetical protein
MSISFISWRCQSLLWLTSAAENATKSGTVNADSVRWFGRMKVRTNSGAGAIAKTQGQSHSII